MIPQIFLDTNVVLDLALNRSEFVENAELIFSLKDRGKIDLHTSTLTLATIAYFAEKSNQDPFLIVGRFVDWIHIVDLEMTFFKQVIASDFLDFEDGLQYFSALKVEGIDAIVTKNTKDYNASKIPILTPAQFLSTIM